MTTTTPDTPNRSPHDGENTTPRSEYPRGLESTARQVVTYLRRNRRVVRWIAVALVFTFVAIAVQKTWAGLPAHYVWHIHWPLLVAGWALLIAHELSFALIWRTILTRLGSDLSMRSAQQIYLGSEFVRYVPGNVWHVLTRVLWAEQRGVPRVNGLASMVIELATKIASGALVFAVTLLAWPDVRGLTGTFGRGLPLTIGLVAIPLLLVGLHPRLLARVLNMGLRKLGRPPVVITLGYRDVLVITVMWSASWIVAGAGFYLLMQALMPALGVTSGQALIIATGIVALSWDIGFLSFVTPSGLGFREGALALLLGVSGLVTVPALAIVIAIVARLAGTAAEVVCVSGAHLLSGCTPELASLRQVE